MSELWNIPPACKVDSVIFKKLFYDNAELSTADKKLFTDVVSKITWFYSLKEENCFIHPYSDELREYPELEVISVQLHEKKAEKRIAEIIMRAIPYPMIIVMCCDEGQRLFVSHQRINQSDREKNVLEEMIFTEWISEEATNGIIDFDKLKKSDFFMLYSDAVDAISVFNAGKISDDELTGEQARLLLQRQQEKEAKVAGLRAQLKKETQFNRKMEISMEIKRLEGCK